jgi:hypothetical protein
MFHELGLRIEELELKRQRIISNITNYSTKGSAKMELKLEKIQNKLERLRYKKDCYEETMELYYAE